MEDSDIILGLFYANELNLVHDNIKFSEKLSDDNINQLKMLSFKFLGPVFLTSSAGEGKSWKIEFIESSLSLHQDLSFSRDVIQSFFSLNSSIETKDGLTNLFALIGSPYTEDTNSIYQKMLTYIHPCILQGEITQKAQLGDEFKFSRFIRDELNRGRSLIEYSLGSTRKIYWEEQSKYICVGIIERLIGKDNKQTHLYTFDKDSPMRRKVLDHIPSYYIMSILPDYYESLIQETLSLFDKKTVYPNLRTIRLSFKQNKVLYLEEYIKENNLKRSYGVIMIPECEICKELRRLSDFKKNIRLILDGNRNPVEIFKKINPHISLDRWGCITDENLNNIQRELDRRD
ncbi:MAG: hypothetical protein GF383_04595 [Candidatus Lokiarchaeota archaeon]|nr:hypothetical protein [Candidatus Lokiarchaeota archaeon]MBD3339064.1 hypothetical protein [Candidatus Lokiarchaeota archaeon]